jgi:signal transduction histidine kinase
VAIVLGDRYRVVSLTSEHFVSDPKQVGNVDLLVLGDLRAPDGLASLPPDLPILWLRSEASAPVPTGPAQASIGRHFDPEELRDKVEALLSRRPRPTFDAVAIIDFPMLPREATQLARSAARTGLPVLISGETGTGKARLARAIHGCGEAQRFISLSQRSCSAAALQQAANLASGDITVFVGEISGIDAEGQDFILELLECGGISSDTGWHSVRAICATSLGLESLTKVEGLDRELLYRLSVLPLRIPPLRERVSDIPALAQHVGHQLGRALSTEPLSFTPQALSRLSHYLWFGNLAEFETVLMRSAALNPHRRLDAKDLLFGYGTPVPAGALPARRARAGAVGQKERLSSNETVSLVINELAHEFKNPMVTIKTVSQGIERMAGDEEGRQQIARLTGDAVERMDRTLENLMQYSRFHSPARHAASLHALLAPCLSDITAVLADRGVALDYHPPVSTVVCVDSAQVSYAFDNLLRAVARDLEEGQTLLVRPLDGASGVVLEFPAGGHGVGAKLAAFSATEKTNGAPPPPLGIVLARTLVERNGGQLEASTTKGQATVTVRLPARGDDNDDADLEGIQR